MNMYQYELKIQRLQSRNNKLEASIKECNAKINKITFDSQVLIAEKKNIERLLEKKKNTQNKPVKKNNLKIKTYNIFKVTTKKIKKPAKPLVEEKNK